MEVTIALAILSGVLLASSLVAVRAFHLGATAKERVSITSSAQAQMEQLRAFRDNHTWAEFLNGGAGYSGVLNGSGSPCVATAEITGTCFHMAGAVLGANHEFIPTAGSMSVDVPTSYIEIAVTPDPASPPQYVDVVLAYGFQTVGGGVDQVGHIKTKLVNIRYASAVGGAGPPPPPCVATPKDIVVLLDHSHSMSNILGAGTRADAARSAVTSLINTVGVGPGPTDNRMLIREFTSTSFLKVPWTGNTAPLLASVAAYDWLNQFGTYYTGPFADVLNDFAGARPGALKILVFVTDGYLDTPNTPVVGTDTWPSALAGANALKAANVSIFSFGISVNNTPYPPDPSALAELQTIAGVPPVGSYFDVSSPADLQAGMDSIVNVLSCI